MESDISKTNPEVVVLIVGSGFSGLYLLHKLRSQGVQTIIHETGSDLGGVWHWNCYPGARVDMEFHAYQYSNREIYESFDFTERFPSREEMVRYFQHVGNLLDLKKDIQFITKVTKAVFDQLQNKWCVQSESKEGRIVTYCRHLVLCTGYATREYIPEFKGLGNFKGEIYHSSKWPHGNAVDFARKRVAVVGTGASGVQIIQELASKVGHLTVYQRTPNLALPMGSNSLSDPSLPAKSEFPSIFAKCRSSFGGLPISANLSKALETPPEERLKFYEQLWAQGGRKFFIGTYADVFYSPEANATAYEFWAAKTRSRINDPELHDILAPRIAPHAFGIKRQSAESNYYEVFNQSNVSLIDIKSSPIHEVTCTGIKTAKEGDIKQDILIFATGFDSVTGGILSIDIKNSNGLSLRDKWQNGIKTHLGLATEGFPNLFFIFGPQAPTAFCNGVVCAEVQGEWVSTLIVSSITSGKVRIEAEFEAEEKWKAEVQKFWTGSLFSTTDNWYQGANIPGKLREPLSYAGGLPNYIEALKNCEENGYQGFAFS